MISGFITLRITKAKAKENSGGGGGSMKFTLNGLSCQKLIGINKFEKAKAKAKIYVGGINFTLFPCQRYWKVLSPPSVHGNRDCPYFPYFFSL